MKPYTLFIALLFLTSVSRAQKFTFNQGGTTAQNYYEELPYETINGKIFLNVEIDGKKHKFLFDTGAPVAISKALAAELKTAVLYKSPVTDAYGKSTDSIAFVSLNKIKLGNTEFNNIPGIMFIPDFYNCWNVDGVIGSNILRNSIVSINPAKHLIILTDNSKKLSLNAKNSSQLVTNTSSQSDPIIKIVIADKVDVTLGFDTGDNTFIRMCDPLLKQFTKPGVYEILAKGYGASNFSAGGLQASANKQLIKFPFITVANSRFDNVITENNKEGSPAIGTKILDYGSVTLDFIHGKFYFDANQLLNNLDEKHWPFQPIIANNKLVIGTVWEKGIGKVKQGDQIVAVDGVDCSTINLCDVINKSILEGKVTAIVSIRDADGNIKKVQINKE